MIKQNISSDNGLKTDLYELTMAAGYFQNKVEGRATFELFCHKLPKERSFLVSCGLEQALDYILNLKFNEDEVKFIKSLPAFKKIEPRFFNYLKSFRFTGDVWAVEEGEIFFEQEPILQVEAPMIEAQILETFLLSVMNIQSLVASKASRVVRAASLDGVERGVVDFGSRRAHGPEAGILAARASYIGGCLGTSNVYAGRLFGIPLYGTVAHSWIEAFESENESFRKYHQSFPDNTILLVDTYDTVKAIHEIAKLEFKEKIKAVRLDSGDLLTLSKKARKILDAQGLRHVKIIASGNLNEFKIHELIEKNAPIDLFGVGTDMVTSRDYPALDLTYKLVQICDQKNTVKFTSKLSQGKQTLPARKQLFRKYAKNGTIQKDVLGLFSEKPPRGYRPLLQQVIKNGRLMRPFLPVKAIREKTRSNLMKLDAPFFHLKRRHKFDVELSRQLKSLSLHNTPKR